MQKAIGYIRVSTVKQSDNGVSLSDQRQKIEDYCNFKGYELSEIIEDKGVSAGIPLTDRPGGQQLQDKLDSNNIEIVISVKLDRLFRDAVDCLNTSKRWDDDGIALHLLDLGGGTLDTSTAMGRMFLTMSAGFAEMEKNLIQERTKNALRYKRDKREVYGHAPLGFKRVGDKLVEVEEELGILDMIFTLREKGLSLRKIAGKLNNEGIETKSNGKKWRASNISYILKNDLYQEVIQ